MPVKLAGKNIAGNPKQLRLDEMHAGGGGPWKKRGPYLSKRQWGTVRKEHDAHPLTTAWRQGVRNRDWFHIANDDVISMPDKWEYPGYAAWDLAFHTIALSIVDLPFAKRQLDMMLRDFYLHPSGHGPLAGSACPPPLFRA